LWHIYLFSTLVDRVGSAAVTLLAKEIPLRLLVEKKADVTMDSKGCRNQNFDGPVTRHGACRIEQNGTVFLADIYFDQVFTILRNFHAEMAEIFSFDLRQILKNTFFSM
jgi:hypothetical protein